MRVRQDMGFGAGAGLIAALTVACSAKMSAPYADVASFCNAKAQAECQIAATCLIDADDCKAQRASLCNTEGVQATTSRAREYTQANAQACIDAVNAAYGNGNTKVTYAQVVGAGSCRTRRGSSLANRDSQRTGRAWSLANRDSCRTRRGSSLANRDSQRTGRAWSLANRGSCRTRRGGSSDEPRFAAHRTRLVSCVPRRVEHPARFVAFERRLVACEARHVVRGARSTAGERRPKGSETRSASPRA